MTCARSVELWGEKGRRETRAVEGSQDGDMWIKAQTTTTDFLWPLWAGAQGGTDFLRPHCDADHGSKPSQCHAGQPHGGWFTQEVEPGPHVQEPGLSC